MNIVEAILVDKHKYNILISGYLWWSNMDFIIKTLANNLNFDVIYADSFVSKNKLPINAEQINFPKLNYDVKSKMDDNKKKNIYKGLIIVSFTFPPEKIEFYGDFHININVNPNLLSKIIVELVKTQFIQRFDIDAHIGYLSNSWKTNKINKYIVYMDNYLDGTNQEMSYYQMFDALMDNIMKKVYGEKYEQLKNVTIADSKYKLPPDNQKMINISNPDILTVKDASMISQNERIGNFTEELEKIVSEDEKIKYDKNGNDNTNTELNIKRPILAKDQYNSFSFIKDQIKIDNKYTAKNKKTQLEQPYYIGRRTL